MRSPAVFVNVFLHTLNPSLLFALRFYGKNSSYVHGGLDSNGKPAEAVYGQSVSKVAGCSFKVNSKELEGCNCTTK